MTRFGILGNEAGLAASKNSFNPPVHERLREIEACVRAEPGAAAHRWALFQCLCVMEAWQRAVQQLQTLALLDPSQTPLVRAYRDLVRAERARVMVLSGEQEPQFIFDTAPAWMRGMHAALRLAAQGQHDAADAEREMALDHAPLVACTRAGQSLAWIADSDTRLGPVCEFITAGCYRWLAFDGIGAWRIARPANLVDLIWAPCALTLRDGTALHGFMPARYPATATGTFTPQERDAFLLGRLTCWHESGRTGVIASGGKTWTTSAGDFGIFELGDCIFGADTAEADARQDSSIAAINES